MIDYILPVIVFVQIILNWRSATKIKELQKQVRINTISRKQNHELIFRKIRRLEVETSTRKNEIESVRKRAKGNHFLLKNKNPHNRIPIPPQSVESWEEITFKDLNK